jgi:hypothetical protein
MAIELGWEIINLLWVVPMFMERARSTPQDELEGFTLGMEIGPLGYYMRDQGTNQLHLIKAILIEGKISFQANGLSVTTMKLGDRRLQSGEGTILGREGVWVATKNQDSGITTVSWRTKDDKPVFEPCPMAGPKKFQALNQLGARVEWKERPAPMGAAGLSAFD